MDEMRIVTPFMRSIVAKLIKRSIKQKTGQDVDVQLENFEMTNIDGKVKVRVNVEAEVDKETFSKLIGL